MAGRSRARSLRRRRNAGDERPDEQPLPEGSAAPSSSYVAKVRTRLEGTRERLEAQRPADSRVDAAFRWIQLQSEAGGALLAGALAFRLFLFLLPFTFTVVIGLGIGADLAESDPRQVARSFGMAGLAATAVQAGGGASSAVRWWTFSLAVFALVLAARNLFRALILSHALIWRMTPAKARHPTTSGLALTAGLLGSTFVLRLVYGSHGTSVVLWIVGLVLFTGVPAAIWLLCSARVFPHPSDVTWRHVLPGALLFGVGVEALHLVTVLYFAPYLQAKSETYGAIGAALAILVWAYLLGRLVTAAAALNAVLWRMPSHHTQDK